jgi:hypothetical protein
MSLGLQSFAAVAAAALAVGATAAGAQPYYGYDALPPAPYQVEGGASYGGCSVDRFTLVGAHAGVTVLGVDLGAGAGLSVPVGGGCAAPAEPYAPRPYAPPAPAAYAPPPYAEPAYAPQAYAPQAYGPPPAYGYAQSYGYAQGYAPPMPAAYPPPCGCAAPAW